jgi:hypothetical protein
MHMAGPREALQHMIIRKNYGCTHFIIGRDMAGCKSSLSGDDFYGPYQAQDFARDRAPELGMETVPSLNLGVHRGRGLRDGRARRGPRPARAASSAAPSSARCCAAARRSPSGSPSVVWLTCCVPLD